MLNPARKNGFEFAEALEPGPSRGNQIADVVGIAQYLADAHVRSSSERERIARAVSSAAHHDVVLLSEACWAARQRVAERQSTQTVVSILVEARRRSLIRSAP